MSVNTVKAHVAAIYRKLGLGRCREAVLRAPRDLELPSAASSPRPFTPFGGRYRADRPPAWIPEPTA